MSFMTTNNVSIFGSSNDQQQTTEIQKINKIVSDDANDNPDILVKDNEIELKKKLIVNNTSFDKIVIGNYIISIGIFGDDNLTIRRKNDGKMILEIQ